MLVDPTVTRRTILRGVSTTVLAPSLTGAARPDTVAAQNDPDIVGEVAMPAWSLLLHEYQDPYLRRIILPPQLVPATRYIPS